MPFSIVPKGRKPKSIRQQKPIIKQKRTGEIVRDHRSLQCTRIAADRCSRDARISKNVTLGAKRAVKRSTTVGVLLQA
jgi:hypothetical protein